MALYCQRIGASNGDICKRCRRWSVRPDIGSVMRERIESYQFSVQSCQFSAHSYQWPDVTGDYQLTTDD
jgi:hypothetical protein